MSSCDRDRRPAGRRHDVHGDAPQNNTFNLAPVEMRTSVDRALRIVGTDGADFVNGGARLRTQLSAEGRGHTRRWTTRPDAIGFIPLRHLRRSRPNPIGDEQLDQLQHRPVPLCRPDLRPDRHRLQRLRGRRWRHEPRQRVLRTGHPVRRRRRTTCWRRTGRISTGSAGAGLSGSPPSPTASTRGSSSSGTSTCSGPPPDGSSSSGSAINGTEDITFAYDPDRRLLRAARDAVARRCREQPAAPAATRSGPNVVPTVDQRITSSAPQRRRGSVAYDVIVRGRQVGDGTVTSELDTPDHARHDHRAHVGDGHPTLT